MIKKISTTLAATGALLLVAGTAQAAVTELVTNGGFETGDFSGWSQAGTAVSIVNPSSGTYSASLFSNGPAGSGVKQNLGANLLTAGQLVTVSFDYRGTTALGGVLYSQLHSINSSGGVSQTDNVVGAGSLTPNPIIWNTFSGTTTIGPDVDGGIDILIVAQCGADLGCLSDWYIDNVSVTANIVPVPAATWLFGSALLGLGGMARKRKAA